MKVFSVLPMLCVLFLAGCATRPSAFYIQGTGEAVVEEVEAPPNQEPIPGLPWRDRVLELEAEASLSNDDLSPGVNAAVARIETREKVFTKIEESLAELRATSDLMMDEYIDNHPAVQDAIATEAAGDEFIYELRKNENLMLARLTFRLEPVAEAVLQSGGGYVPEGQGRPPTQEQLRAKAIRTAQQEALNQAREDLQNEIYSMTESGSGFSEPAEKAIHFSVMKNAYPIESALTADQTWRVVLETNIAPLWDYLDHTEN